MELLALTYSVLYYGCAIILGFVLAFCYVVFSSPYRKNPLLKIRRRKPKEAFISQRIATAEAKTEPATCHIYKAIDDIVAKIVNNLFRDYFITWFAKIADDRDAEKVMEDLKQQTFMFIRNLYRKVSQIDTCVFLCNKMTPTLTDHLKQLNSVSYDVRTGQNMSTFQVHVCLRDAKSEDDYLRKLCVCILKLAAPDSVIKSSLTRTLVRELLTKYLLHSLMDTFSRPEYINSLICTYLKSEETKKNTKSSQTSLNYKDLNGFIRALNSIDDVERLQLMCKRIVTEINQATMLQIVKEENQRKGYKRKISSDISLIGSRPVTKADRLMARDLKQYISELSLAKARAERRIVALGGNLDTGGGYVWMNSGEPKVPRQTSTDIHSPGQLVPASLDNILACPDGYMLFHNFLETISQNIWLDFWKEVQIITKEKSQNNHHQKADSLYREYVHCCTNQNFKLPQNIAEGMHQYILGNSGLEVFHSAQEYVFNHMKKFLSSFYLTQGYERWVLNREDTIEGYSNSGYSYCEDGDEDDEMNDGDSDGLSKHSHQITQAEVQKLKELQDKIARKNYVIKQMEDSAIKFDAKLFNELQNEVAELREKEISMENMISDLDVWFSHKGMYRINVTDCLPMPEKNINEPNFILELYLGDEAGFHHSTILVSNRLLSEIQQLYNEMLPAVELLKKFELPKSRRFRSYDVAYCSEAKILVEAFLNFVLSDPVAFDSQILFNFLRKDSDRKEVTQKIANISKKSHGRKYTLTNSSKKRNWKGSSDRQGSSNQGLPPPMYLPVGMGDFPNMEDVADELTEPLFKLIDEVFELRGMMKVFRQSLMTFLKSRYQMTLSKRIKDNANWLVSDQMLRYYFESFLNSFWPPGSNTSGPHPSTDEPVTVTSEEDKQKLRERQRC